MIHVSVVIPTFDRKAMLSDSVASALDQTYRDFELIVVDDGSTDDTRQFVESLRRDDNRVKYVYQENRGVSAARNTGIQLARGEFIAFLDSDDYWKKAKLAAQIEFFARNPDIKVCQTEEIWIRNGVRKNPRRKHKKYAGDIFEQSLPLCIITPSAVMMDKTVFEVVGFFDEELPACEDYDMWLRITAKYNVGLLPEALVVKYGGHPDQLSATIPSLDKYRIRAIEKMILSGTLSPRQRSTAFDELRRKCKIYANGCKKHNRIDEYNHYTSLPEGLEVRD